MEKKQSPEYKNFDLNEKQKKFAEEWSVDMNGKKAAIRAGYSEKTAEVKASQLLSLVKVKEYIKFIREKQVVRTEVTSDMVISELAKIAFSDIRKLYREDGTLIHISDLDDDTSSTISSFKSRKESIGNNEYDTIDEYKRYDKIKSLELLGKHLGLFSEKIDLTSGNKEIEYIGFREITDVEREKALKENGRDITS